MPDSLIITCDPSINSKLQAEYKNQKSILLLEKFAEQLLQKKGQASFRTTPAEKILYIRSLRKRLFADIQLHEEFDEVAETYIRHLKSQKILPKWFYEAAAKTPLKQEFYLKIAKLFQAYEEKHPWLDDEDVLKKAISRIKSDRTLLSSVSQILVMGHEFKELEKDFLDNVGQVIPEMKWIELVSLDRKHTSLTVWEAQNSDLEVEAIVQEIKKISRKTSCPTSGYSSITLFCGDTEREKHLLMMLEKENIPYSCWQNHDDHLVGDSLVCDSRVGDPRVDDPRVCDPDCVSIFKWSPNTLVFGRLKTVFVCGLGKSPTQELNDPFCMLSHSEKLYFNDFFGKTVFKTSDIMKEETQRLLGWLASRSQKLYVTYSHSVPWNLKGFLEEYSHDIRKIDEPKPTAFTRGGNSGIGGARVGNHRVIGARQKYDFLPKVYSISSLAQYQRCPYGFLVKECFGLKPLKKVTLELIHEEEGELIHHILWRYFKALQNIGQNTKNRATDPRVTDQTFENVLEESFKSMQKRFQKEIFYPDRLRIAGIVQNFLEEEEKWRNKSRFQPRFFECSFGITDHFLDDHLVSSPLELKWKGKSVKLRGKIDRLDVDETQKEFMIIDYKTGSQIPSHKEVLSGKAFQLTLYAIAIETLFLKEYFPTHAYFYSVKEGNRKKGFELNTREEWKELKDRTLEEVFNLISQIEKFSFGATPESCYPSCELKKICSQE